MSVSTGARGLAGANHEQAHPEPARYEDAVLGFRNHWYPAMFSSDIRETEIKTLKLLGEDILLKRVDGHVYAVRDECLHRGFQFSAKPECFTKNTITCWFHGFTYSFKDGSLVGIPSDPESKLIGKLKLHSYPVEEHKGMLFVFVGDLNPPPPLADDLQPGFLDEDRYIVPFHQEEVASNWRIAADSASEFNHTFIHKEDDLIHYWRQPLPFAETPRSDNPYEGFTLHEGPGPKGFTDSFTDVIPVFEFKIECDDEVEVVRSAYNPMTEQGSLSVQAIDATLTLPCGLRIGPWGANPGDPASADYVQYEWYVPVDETHHRYIIAWAKKVSSEVEALKVEHDVRTRWSYIAYDGFNASDVRANEGSQRAYSEDGYEFGEKENLSRIDAYVLTWRRLAAKHNRGLQVRYGGKK
ncbi:Rieske 2Fe-2S domain-containing protein [Pseudonocardia sp. T1-2H]|uniref:Rieske 2Fe-2S domain-containing protein n=1 Tax=Pseudonocardia sp. T1-2H TaxID=3128899 RepID=UPI00310168CE